MIEVKETNDRDYVKSVLSNPGMGRLCNGGKNGPDVGDIDAVVDLPIHRFLEVTENGIRKGFVSFTEFDGSHFIHLALYTRGEKTLDAFGKAVDYARDNFGYKEIHAIYPEGRKSLDRIAKAFSFNDLEKFEANEYGRFDHKVKVLNN